MSVPKKSISSREITTKTSSINKITNSWKPKPKNKTIFNEIKKPARITYRRRSSVKITETITTTFNQPTTSQSNEKILNKLEPVKVTTSSSLETPEKQPIETPNSKPNSSNSSSSKKVDYSYDTPEKQPLKSLIKTPNSSSSTENRGKIDGTEIQIDDLDEFNLSILSSGNEIVLNDSLIDELAEFVDIKNSDEDLKGESNF